MGVIHSANQFRAEYRHFPKDPNQAFFIKQDGVVAKGTGEMIPNSVLNVPLVRLNNGRTFLVAPQAYGKWNDLGFFEKKGLFRAWTSVQLINEDQDEITKILKAQNHRPFKERFSQFFRTSSGFLVGVSKNIKVNAHIHSGELPSLFVENSNAHRKWKRGGVFLTLNNDKMVLIAPKVLGKGWKDLVALQCVGIFRRGWKEVKLSKEEMNVIRVSLVERRRLNRIPLIGNLVATKFYNANFQ